MIIIGITGCTGAGKTTALNVLSFDFRAKIIDCDVLYHELLSFDKDMLSEIKNRFPGAFHDGIFVRKELGKIVFNDEKALLDLNEITHAYIRKSIKSIIENEKQINTNIIAIDAIALIESGLGELCDFVVGVIADEDTRVARIMRREGITEEYARLRISAQKSNEYFEKECDFTLSNNYDTQAEFESVCREFFDKKVKEVK